MKKLIIFVFIVLVMGAFLSSCTPRIRFDLEPTTVNRKRIFIDTIEDFRPLNERQGYKIFYVDSISDDDYEGGFLNEFKRGFISSLGDSFTLVSQAEHSDISLKLSVYHFYGEYSQTVKTVLWEYGTVILLFIPRLVTDLIPYNTFAGRVAIDLSFTGKNGIKVNRSLDVNVTDSVSTYKRSSSGTSSRLSKAASVEMNKIFQEVLTKI